MKTILVTTSLACALGIASAFAGIAVAAGAIKVDNLMHTGSRVAEGVEIIVSVIEIGPDSTLPKHYHPGEEFVYLLEGSAIVWQQGKAETTLKAGDLYKIPLQQVHTAVTAAGSAKAIVFRVHEKGEADRILVE
jgi:quercetin dioxygenase-like cupin family protein